MQASTLHRYSARECYSDFDEVRTKVVRVYHASVHALAYEALDTLDLFRIDMRAYQLWANACDTRHLR